MQFCGQWTYNRKSEANSKSIAQACAVCSPGTGSMSAIEMFHQSWSVVRKINHCSDQPNQRSQ
jgi:hypothetical protein